MAPEGRGEDSQTRCGNTRDLEMLLRQAPRQAWDSSYHKGPTGLFLSGSRRATGSTDGAVVAPIVRSDEFKADV